MVLRSYKSLLMTLLLTGFLLLLLVLPGSGSAEARISYPVRATSGSGEVLATSGSGSGEVLATSGSGSGEVLATSGGAAVVPLVKYYTETNTIEVGSEARRTTRFLRNGTLPSEGLSVTLEVMTIPELAAELGGQGHSGLLVEEEEGAWLLKAHLLINTTARLSVTDSTISWLRLESTGSNQINVTAARGGLMLIDGIKVTSWDTGAAEVDTQVEDGRSYMLAHEGGRLDILNAEVAYLGWAAGEPSGLSWRKRLHEDDPTTGATGRVENSVIHHNYFGFYTYEAYGLQIINNQVRDNIYYGIDPHDYSYEFEVAYNTVYNNGNHGIIFSRFCENNQIHHNEVYSNTGHGIMLDRGTNNNVVEHNLVYSNTDGIALFQSSDNLIQYNTFISNSRGVRINATYDADDEFDGISSHNQVMSNTIANNAQYGVYLYERADQNLMQGNQIVGSGLSGVYIKTGGNQISGNIIREGGSGITIIGGASSELPPEAMPALEESGHNNIIVSNVISENSETGIQLRGAVNTRIGSEAANPVVTTSVVPYRAERLKSLYHALRVLHPPDGEGNIIENNGSDGILIAESSLATPASDNLIFGNTIWGNGRYGVRVKEESSLRNRISRNSISNNVSRGIKISDGAQAGITSPFMTTVDTTTGQISGEALPNSTIELYNDPEGEGAVYEGETTADSQGNWSFIATGVPELVTAIAIDGAGNTSQFSGASEEVQYTIGNDGNGQATISVTGEEATVTLPDIQSALTAQPDLLEALGNGVWLLNANLLIERNITLDLTSASGVSELRLRSEESSSSEIDYSSFVYLRTNNGIINIDGVKVHAWDTQAANYDEDYADGRSYILAKYDASLSITNSELSYLGSADGESYGVSWRDINDPDNPDQLRTRVTGEVLNSLFHHNYYGIYTYQASQMTFRNNKFYQNIRYGFDPHDYTHDVLVENNEAYANGSHGFIISRGCNNFIFRDNTSYDNHDPGSSLAHGFMLDPGSPNSEDPQAPSTDNLLEENEAYGNEGYALRILDSDHNTVQKNNFHDNLHGIVIDQGSTDNKVSDNQLTNHSQHGIFVRGTANNNDITSNITQENGEYGIYIKSNYNLISQNNATSNQEAGIRLLPESDTQAAIADLLPPALRSVAIDAQLIGQIVAQESLDGNQLIENNASFNESDGLNLKSITNSTIEGNIIKNNAHGIYLSDGVMNSIVQSNTIQGNSKNGIYLSGEAQNNQLLGNSLLTNGEHGAYLTEGTTQNQLIENRVEDNQQNGIYLRDGANDNLISNNQVSANGNHGIYIKSNNNIVSQNSSYQNKEAGIALLPESEANGTLPSESLTENQIISNSLSLNGDHGLELKGALNTTVEGNTIEENPEHAIYLSDGTQNSQIIANILRSNGGQGIRANREETMHNKWSQNQIYNNQSDGIILTSGANESIQAPVISTILSGQVIGTAKANSRVELFSDGALQGRYFEGYTTADSAGHFTFFNPSGWQGANITAIATDSAGNSSAFASHKIEFDNVIYLPLVSQ